MENAAVNSPSDAKPGAPIRIGTRGSALALWQANWVHDQLAAVGISSEVLTISSRGDLQPDAPIASIGGDGVFTKELQKALLDGRINVAVHSLKDLPTEAAPGLVVACVPERESVNDVIICREPGSSATLPEGARIGTGSLRRRAQLLHLRPDLKMLDIRGNIDTRLRKLADGEFDALVLAEAGLKRLGLESRITEILSAPQMLPAVGQGALGLETRFGDHVARKALESIDDPESHQSVLAERTMLAALAGGCLAPIGAWGRVESDGRLRLTACVLSADGKQRLAAERVSNAADALALGRQVADELLAAGAAKLIEQSRAGP
jgi:hydroxymethylbilane synthase